MSREEVDSIACRFVDQVFDIRQSRTRARLAHNASRWTTRDRDSRPIPRLEIDNFPTEGTRIHPARAFVNLLLVIAKTTVASHKLIHAEFQLRSIRCNANRYWQSLSEFSVEPLLAVGAIIATRSHPMPHER